MTGLVIVGTQWGDEGKGKIVDWLAAEADMVARFQGGNNAGHTLVIDGKTFKLSLLPSGIIRQDVLCIIGNGVVLDPWKLQDEINMLASEGIKVTPENLNIADNVHLILPVHRALDAAFEAARGSGKIGTTGRGIGPAYEDKVARRGIRLAGLMDEVFLQERVEALVFHHNKVLSGYGADLIDGADILGQLLQMKDFLLSFARPVWRIIDQAHRDGQKILFEGAQGIHLDIDYGTYPYVTSSNTIAGQAAQGTGINRLALDKVLGIVKAYTTRVGTGPFPTELDDDVGHHLGTKGHEFGTVTGRKRRCGWFDAALVRQAVMVSGVDELVLTKLDVLDGLETLSICTGYTLDGTPIDYMPSLVTKTAHLVPVYETMPGWVGETTTAATTHAELPDAAKAYIRRIEELVGVPVTVISNGPGREQTIVLRHPFDVGRSDHSVRSVASAL